MNLTYLTVGCAVWLMATLGSTSYGQSGLSDTDYRVIDPRLGSSSSSHYMVGAGVNYVKYYLGYDAHSKEVVISWHAYVAGGAHDAKARSFSTPFVPLAVTGEAGVSDTIYVVGWVERTDELVVEKWHMHGALVGQTMGPPGGQPIVTLTPPRIDKTEIVRTARGPCDGAVFHPTSRKLILLCEVIGSGSADEKELVSVSVDDSPAVVDTMYSAAQIGALYRAAGIDLGVTKVTGAVYIFLFEQHLVTQPTLGSEAEELQDPSQYTHVLCDNDSDGIFEVSYEDGHVAIAIQSSEIEWSVAYTASAPN